MCPAPSDAADGQSGADGGRSGAAGGQSDAAGGIRTYHARRGRVGPAAAEALSRLMPRYGLAASGPPVDPESLFGAPLPLAVEFGSGTGEAALQMARTRPDIGIIAVDVHNPGVGRLLRGIEAHGIGNVRVVHGDGVALLRERIPEGGLSAFRAFFPDPWPKARHHKRRLVRGELMALVSSRLRRGGSVHLATDWQHYAEQMVAVLQEAPGLTLVDRDRAAVPPRPETRFERKALREGRTVHDVFALATHR